MSTTQLNKTTLKSVFVADITDGPKRPVPVPGDLDRARFELLKTDVRQNGILVPLLVVATQASEYSLIDGASRIRCARELNMMSVPCQILPIETPLEDLYRTFLQAHFGHITQSAIRKAVFIGTLLNAGISKSIISDMFWPSLGLSSQLTATKLYITLAGFPEPIARFCHQKQFSMKQLTWLSAYSVSLMTSVLAWQSRLTLSASIFLEFLELLHDEMRSKNISIAQLFEELNMDALLTSSLSPSKRTQQLRADLHARRKPTIAQVNSTLAHIKSKFDLPKGVDIRWDPALERHQLDISVTLTTPSQWHDVANTLSSPAVAEGISELFDHL